MVTLSTYINNEWLWWITRYERVNQRRMDSELKNDCYVLTEKEELIQQYHKINDIQTSANLKNYYYSYFDYNYNVEYLIEEKKLYLRWELYTHLSYIDKLRDRYKKIEIENKYDLSKEQLSQI